jgi:hypothetical protein
MLPGKDYRTFQAAVMDKLEQWWNDYEWKNEESMGKTCSNALRPPRTLHVVPEEFYLLGYSAV